MTFAEARFCEPFALANATEMFTASNDLTWSTTL